MSFVFTPEWIAELTAEQKVRPSFHQSLVFRIATRPEWETERSNIEEWVAKLPLEHMHSVISRLRTDEQFTATYNELLVGSKLHQLGYSPIYEPSIGNQKPDWFISNTDDIPAFFVEVLTLFPSKENTREERVWNELRERLRKIEHYYDVMIASRSTSAIHGKDQKKIVRFLVEWLNQYDPQQTNETREVTYKEEDLAIQFTLIPRKSRTKKAIGMAGPVFTKFINPSIIRAGISKKINKYEAIKNQHTALVVAIVPTVTSGLEVNTLLEALIGRERVSIPDGRISRDNSGILTPKRIQGRFEAINTRLSAVIWLQHRDGTDIRVIHNPYALHKLPVTTFRNIPNLVSTERTDEYFVLEWVMP